MASMARLRVHAAGSVRGHLRQMSAHVGKKQVPAQPCLHGRDVGGSELAALGLGGVAHRRFRWGRPRRL
eukprot:2923732-Rhodomonas_salina.2